jgi:hypothetical protein
LSQLLALAPAAERNEQWHERLQYHRAIRAARFRASGDSRQPALLGREEFQQQTGVPIVPAMDDAGWNKFVPGHVQ